MKNISKLVLPLLLGTAAVLVYAAGYGRSAGTTTQTTAMQGRTPAAGTTRIERGRYLVTALGCEDCHSPKVMGKNGPELDPARKLSGFPETTKLPPAPAPAGPWIATTTWDMTAWSGPWGVSYAINLTPDEDTGIGSWSEETFVQAVKTGRHMGVARPILPPMPWPAYRNLTSDDLGAIYAYLRTLPAIHNRTPEPVPPPQQEAQLR